MRATRELLRAVGIVTRLTHRPAAAHDHTSRRAVASFSTTPLSGVRRDDDGDAQRIMPALVRVSSLTDDADFDGVVPLLVEKLTNVIRAVDGSNPVAVVTSRNDEAARGMTRRRLEHQSGAVTLFPDLTSALSATREQQAGSHRVETDINRSARKEFNYDAKFAGDVDVDDVELRCTKHDWGAGDGLDSEVENLQRGSTSTATSTSFNAIVVHACDASDVETASHASLNVVVIDALSMLADHGDYGEVIPLDESRIEKLKAADVVVMHHACLLPTPASTEAIERHLMEHVGTLGPDDDKKNSLNAPAVVRTRVRCVRTERLHRYAGASPAHEWTPPPSRLRGARVLGMTGCKRGDGRRRGLARLLENMVAPAVDDTKNGYGLRLRRTGQAEVRGIEEEKDSASVADGFFTRTFLETVVERFREMHRVSGDVGSAEARLVLSERDAWRLLTGGSRDRILDGLNFLTAADPLVLSFALALEDENETAEETLRERMRRHLASPRG